MAIQTQHAPERSSRATNGLGWEVQLYTCPHGWRAISKPFDTIGLAREAMNAVNDPDGIFELRVYEALRGAYASSHTQVSLELTEI